MTELAFLVIGLVAGYFHRDARERIKAVTAGFKSVPEPKNEGAPKSLLVEPLTPEQEAQRDMAERVKRLNS